jgi:hypothetical protein
MAMACGVAMTAGFTSLSFGRHMPLPANLLCIGVTAFAYVKIDT